MYFGTGDGKEFGVPVENRLLWNNSIAYIASSYENLTIAMYNGHGCSGFPPWISIQHDIIVGFYYRGGCLISHGFFVFSVLIGSIEMGTF